MDTLSVLRKIANAARDRYLELAEKEKDELAKKVRRSIYGHQSSFLDVEVEKSIIEFVEVHDLPFDIFTEEAGKINRGYERVLIVDPIDGSYNAEHGIPFFSVSLAIGKKSLRDVEVGFVKNIPLDIDYWAIRGEGAYRDGERLRTGGRSDLYVVYLGRNASEMAYKVAGKARRVRDLGCASLEMITVAEGISDVFFYSFRKSGALRIVDVAASSLIVEEAGGLVLDESLKPLNMRIDAGERKNVIAVANKDMMGVFK